MTGSVTVSRPGSEAPVDWQPRIVALVCNWCSYAGADMAGTTRLQYPASVRLVRFPCTGRMSPMMIVKAFEGGADGVLVSGCHPGDCHYVQGNLVARRRFSVFRSLMGFLGVDLRRLHFAWVSAAEGRKWADVVGRVTEEVRAAGPLEAIAEVADGPRLELPEAVGEVRETGDDDVAGISRQLRDTASELLASGAVDSVLGYRRGSLPEAMPPAIVEDPEGAAELVWGAGCVANPATYLPRVAGNGRRTALFVKRCDVPAVTSLIREGQVARDDIVLVGVPCSGVRHAGAPAVKCSGCGGAPHPSCDLHVTPEAAIDGPFIEAGDAADEVGDPRDQQIAVLEAMPAAERWRYWQRQFSRCLRCYACRAACPLCYCSSCVAEKHRPQWVSPRIDRRGNTAWNIVRAMHLAGRCTGCDECARACPADVRLDLINRKLALEVERLFGAADLDPETLSALLTFRDDDTEEFIL